MHYVVCAQCAGGARRLQAPPWHRWLHNSGQQHSARAQRLGCYIIQGSSNAQHVRCMPLLTLWYAPFQ